MTRQAVLESESWDFEEDLANVASRAALELDNIILGRTSSVDAVRMLQDQLSRALTDVTDPGDPHSRLDPTTAVVVNFALADATGTTRLGRLDDLLQQTETLKRKLSDLLNSPDDFKRERAEDIQKLRDFCIALARRALSISGAHLNEHPDHPYRR